MQQGLLNCDQDITILPRPHYSPRSTSGNRGNQLTLSPEIPVSQYLTVVAVPPAQRVSPDQDRYILILKPSGLRLAGGQFFDHEIDQIIASTKAWNWTLDSQGRLGNLGQFELLIDEILRGLK